MVRFFIQACVYLCLASFTTAAWTASPTEVYARSSAAVVALTCSGPLGRYYGTGALISADGLILTNITVIPPGSHDITIHFTDGRKVPATLVATDMKSEAALVDIDGNDHPYFVLADDTDYRVGDPVYTWGNPHQTLEKDGMVAFSSGIVSGLYPISSMDDQSRYRGAVIETDAAINPGSDGGPLTDIDGRLIGIQSLAWTNTRWLGLSIPISVMRDHVPEIAAIPVDEQAPRRPMMNQRIHTVLSEVAPAVVKIYIAGKGIIPPESLPSLPQKERAINRQMHRMHEQQLPEGKYSTGFLIDASGIVCTSSVALSGWEQGDIWLYTASHGKVPAEVLCVDTDADVALLQILDPMSKMPSKKVWPRIPWTDAGGQTGHPVIVPGRSELGSTLTCTLGRVSATGRRFQCADQISARLNYGNTGGPVLDLHGKAIGLACWLSPETDWRQNAGVGFSLNAQFIKENLDLLIDGKKTKLPQRSFLGIRSDPTHQRHVKILNVVDDSPAAAAGIQPHDVINKMDGIRIQNWSHFSSLMDDRRPNTAVTFSILRGDKELSFVVTLGYFKDFRP